MKKHSWLLILIGILLITVACSDMNEEMNLPEGLPDFIQKSDFENIKWENKAVEFGDRGIIGNENKSGVIGVDAPSLTGQKWMWHLWNVPDDVEMTVVGYHRETQKIHQLLKWPAWTIQMGGPNNGADAHTPSSVKVHEAGEWAVFLYTNGKLFDVLIFEINE